ncbi:MAG: class I adenylate-forming enzyme family protein [bacterium]
MPQARNFPARAYEGIVREIYDDVESFHYRDRPDNLVELLDRSVARFGSREAVVDDNARLTYREFDRLCNNLAASLRKLGVRKGDRVAILMPNSWEYAVSYFGILRLGAIAVLLNWRCAGPELDYMINDSGAIHLLMSAQYRDKIAGIRGKLNGIRGIFAQGGPRAEGTSEFGDLLKEDAAARVVCDPPVTQRDPAAILYTSGTTGVPKGALVTHRNSVANAINAAMIAEGDENDRTLIIAPMFHATGIHSQLTAFVGIGGCSVIRAAFDPIDTLKTIQNEKITFGAGVAAMFWVILNMTPWKDYDLSSLKYFVFGGSPVPVELFHQMIEAFPHVRFGNVFGLTEATSIVTYNTHADVLRIPESVGRPVPILEVKIADPISSGPLPSGKVGEILVKGPTVVKGYWNKPEATRQTFVEGWVRTGDLGHVDSDGYVYVVDRIKDMIVSGGENIYCIEVENAIMQHPAVLEVGVVGVPDPVMQEAVKAVVFLKPGASATEQEIIDHCRKLIASYKKPKHVVFSRAMLPRNPGGKILKSSLKEML